MFKLKNPNRYIRRFKSWLAYDPPGAMSMHGWKLFKAEFKEKAPIRFFFSETVKRKVILKIKWKYEAIADYVRYRTYDKYHVIDTGLAPGYYSVEKQMLNVNFNMLKEFVEVEQAHHQYIWSDEYKKSASFWEKHLPLYYKFKPFRRPDLGIKHFEWAATLDDPSLPVHERAEEQAVSAREILFLYNWWVNIYPKRKEIEIPGLNDKELSTHDDLDLFGPMHPSVADVYRQNSDLRDKWDKEDTEMLQRLVAIRSSLWT